MGDHRPKLPSNFRCFYFKMPSWMGMLDVTFQVVECLSVLSIHFGYFSEILITHNFPWRLQLPRWWEGSIFSERKPTAERKWTVPYQKIEQHVESSGKQELTANEGTDGLGSLSLKCHPGRKKNTLNWECMWLGAGNYWRFHAQYICFWKKKSFVLHFLYFFVNWLKFSWTAAGRAEHKDFPFLHST